MTLLGDAYFVVTDEPVGEAMDLLQFYVMPDGEIKMTDWQGNPVKSLEAGKTYKVIGKFHDAADVTWPPVGGLDVAWDADNVKVGLVTADPGVESVRAMTPPIRPISDYAIKHPGKKVIERVVRVCPECATGNGLEACICGKCGTDLFLMDGASYTQVRLYLYGTMEWSPGTMLIREPGPSESRHPANGRAYASSPRPQAERSPSL